MQLLFKRTKIFMHGNDRYVGSIGSDGRAPLWIKQTDTWKHGIADGSIIDLRAEAEKEEAEVAVTEPMPVANEPKVPALTPSTGRKR